MPDRKEKLTPVTVGLHWLIAITIIGMVAFGLYIADLPRGDWKSELIGIHKLIGFTVIFVALPRILWRWGNGWPVHIGDYVSWEKTLAKFTHWFLIIATIAMPVSVFSKLARCHRKSRSSRISAALFTNIPVNP